MIPAPQSPQALVPPRVAGRCDPRGGALTTPSLYPAPFSTGGVTSLQTAYPSLPCRHESSLTPSLLLSKPRPLHWVVVWFFSIVRFVQNGLRPFLTQLPCSSSPNRNRCAGLRIGDARESRHKGPVLRSWPLEGYGGRPAPGRGTRGRTGGSAGLWLCPSLCFFSVLIPSLFLLFHPIAL